MSSSQNQKNPTVGKGEFLIPLNNLEIDPELPLKISEHAELRITVMNERDFGKDMETDFKLTMSYQEPNVLTHDRQMELAEEAKNLIWALRLVKPGEVGANRYYNYTLRPGRFTPFVSGPLSYTETTEALKFTPGGLIEPGRRRWPAAKYKLCESDLDETRKLFNIFHKKSKQIEPMMVALRRFNLSYSRYLSEDIIIDLTIALENCLLYGISDEFRYRLSVRGAWLLAGSKKPQEVKKFLKGIYDIRSRIVHGGESLEKMDKNFIELGIKKEEFLPSTENIVRDILREYIYRIDQGKSIEEIIKELEAEIP